MSQGANKEPARSPEKPAMIQGVSKVPGGSNESEKQPREPAMSQGVSNGSESPQ